MISTNPKYKDNLIVQLSFEFTIQIIEYSDELKKKEKSVVAYQLLKSGTSIGANIREAQNSESLKDFIHKIKLALKETDETEYWLMLCQHAKNYPDPNHLIDNLNTMGKIMNRIIQSAKKRSTLPA